jgi:hypothetical protein
MHKSARLVVVSLIILGCSNREDGTTDYQRKADKQGWKWAPEEANLLYSIVQHLPDYEVQILCQKGSHGELVIRIKDSEGFNVLTLKGHSGTVFTRIEDVIYVAKFSPDSTGCTLVAFDLGKRKELWNSRLRGLGPLPHSLYENAVVIKNDGTTIYVRGKETGGRYIEYVDARTGKMVGHKVFKDS